MTVRWAHLAGLLACVAIAGCEPSADPGSSVMRVRMTGEQFRWHIRYPGADGRLDTRDDVVTLRDLHLPSDTATVISLESRDYLYTLELPQLGLKQIAVPDLRFELRIDPAPEGSSDLLGSQMCGYDHPDLLGKFVVQSRPDFTAWLRKVRAERRREEG